MAETKTKKVKKVVKSVAKKPAASSLKKPTRPAAKSNSKPTSKLGSGFAVIETGGKQYKVSAGDTIHIEKISGNHKQGDTIMFDKILLLSEGAKVTLGEPYIKGATVSARFEETGRAKKINILKFKRKIRHTKRQGHRQPYTKVTFS